MTTKREATALIERLDEVTSATNVRTAGREQAHDTQPWRARRRGQRGEERRQELLHAMRTADEPLLGSELAQRFGVSRQVLVQDTAILRAAGADIIATPRGYLLRNPEPVAHRDVLRLQHDHAALADVLTILVDLGIHVVDDVIDHPVYGALRVDLRIASRQDVRELFERFTATNSAPLQELTGGRHSHTVEAPRRDLLVKARDALKERGYLIA